MIVNCGKEFTQLRYVALFIYNFRIFKPALEGWYLIVNVQTVIAAPIIIKINLLDELKF